MEVPGSGEDLVSGEELDLHEIDLALETGQLFLELLQALLQGAVLAAKALDRDLVGDVGAVNPVHFGPDPGFLLAELLQGLFLARQGLVGPGEVGGHVIRREEEPLELLLEDGLEIADADSVPALQTYFGLSEYTYIFAPQWQRTMPAKRWTGCRPGAFPSRRRPTRMALHCSQSSSETIGSTG